MSWREDLEEIIGEFYFDPRDDETLAEINSIFQDKRPGPYTIHWEGEMSVRIDFTDDEEMTFWLLANS